MGWGVGLSEQARPAAHARRAQGARECGDDLGLGDLANHRQLPAASGAVSMGGVRWVVRGGCRVAHRPHPKCSGSR